MKIEARFCKKGALAHISHLDVVRLFQRAVRRAGLNVSLSQGYSPHYRIGFGNALKLGVESEDEKVTFKIEGWISPDGFESRLNEKLPEGIKVLGCKRRY